MHVLEVQFGKKDSGDVVNTHICFIYDGFLTFAFSENHVGVYGADHSTFFERMRRLNCLFDSFFKNCFKVFWNHRKNQMNKTCENLQTHPRKNLKEQRGSAFILVKLRNLQPARIG